MSEQIYRELLSLSGGEEKRAVLQRFFKTGPGQYGEGDQFLGVTVPNVRQVARLHARASLDEVEACLRSPWHEVRLCGLLVLTLQAAQLDKLRRKGNLAWLAALVGCFGRFLIHFVSGVTIYAEYVSPIFGWNGTSPVIYSILYNGSYMLPNTVIAVVICALLQFPLRKYLCGNDLVKQR